MATASFGTLPRPAMSTVFGTLEVNAPVVPLPTRESRRRTGAIPTKTEPAVWSWLTVVAHVPSDFVYWLPCQTAFVSRGSWATPDVVAPTVAVVGHGAAARDQPCRAEGVDGVGGELVAVVRGHSLCRQSGPRLGVDDVEDAALRLADPRIPGVLAVRADEHVLDQRRDRGRRVELGDAGTRAQRAVAPGRIARPGRGEGQDVVLPDRVRRPTVDDPRIERPAWIDGYRRLLECLDRPCGLRSTIWTDVPSVAALVTVPVILK